MAFDSLTEKLGEVFKKLKINLMCDPEVFAKKLYHN